MKLVHHDIILDNNIIIVIFQRTVKFRIRYTYVPLCCSYTVGSHRWTSTLWYIEINNPMDQEDGNSRYYRLSLTNLYRNNMKFTRHFTKHLCHLQHAFILTASGSNASDVLNQKICQREWSLENLLPIQIS